jgi:protein-tyrosine phosphatase
MMKYIFWVRGNPPAPLAIVLCPPGGRGLRGELLVLKHAGIETLVSLLESEEAYLLGLSEEGRLAEQAGLQFLSFPVPDAHPPQNTPLFRGFIAGLADRLSAGESVGIHCRGSIGRATVAAACALIHLGWQPQAALKAITRARGQAVPDTEEQEDWIMRYKPLP